jgi:hypothetical protein
MQKILKALLSGFAALGIAASAHGLTIISTFDSSITNDPNGAAMMKAINAAVQVMQSNIADNFTVYIQFVNDTNVDLGQSLTYGNSYAYGDYLAALRSLASDANDTNALSKLPKSATDPVIGGNQIHLTLPLARWMGLDWGTGPGGVDSTISLNMPLMNFTRPATNSTNYDLQAVAEHEMDEVLGTSSGLPATSPIWAADLFRYTTNLTRTYITSGDNAYFSVNGTNLLARYNMDPSGDYGDWWSEDDIFWAPPGHMPVPQVQDAFADPGTFQDLGTNELALLDVIGWTLTGNHIPATARPSITYDASIPGQISMSWPAYFDGFTLQESTSLAPGSWADSGNTNIPAYFLTYDAPKFYRLSQKAGAMNSVPEPMVASQPLPPSPHQLELVTRVFRPRKP